MQISFKVILTGCVLVLLAGYAEGVQAASTVDFNNPMTRSNKCKTQCIDLNKNYCVNANKNGG